jgi:hypothetical protein
VTSALPQRELVPVGPPPDGGGFRLGEVVLVAGRSRGLSAHRLGECIVQSGYDRLGAGDGCLHFRPRTTWRAGIGRHACLRRRDLLVLPARDARGRFHLVGLLTAPLERRLRALGELYTPVRPTG